MANPTGDVSTGAFVAEEMDAAVYRSKRDLQIERRPTPSVGPEDVLIAVEYCGICGTDLHFVMEGWGRPNSIGGHEYSGRIVRVGAEVEGFCPGDAVVGGPESGCGECEYCASGRTMLCPARSTPGVSEFQGAFADYICVHQSQLLHLPEGLSLRDAALAEPLAVALHGITRSGIAPGQRALITGVGPIGMLTLAALRARGIDEVTVSEPSAVRRELAAKLGATQVIAPEDLEVPAMPFMLAEGAYDASFECSGKASAVEACLAMLRKGGTLVIQGTGADRASLDGNRVLLNELVITGAYCYDDRGLEAALELLAAGGLDTDLLLYPEDVPLRDLAQAMESLVAGEIGGKVMVVPR
ncbi:MAG: alcohol dehydrogenase catalytic domain-containing protein [Deltaproteobacteria bacterium]|nr:alcohol dehydrogenase catalytic domain-containing protein [Deltaproteobacteria bacterium]